MTTAQATIEWSMTYQADIMTAQHIMEDAKALDIHLRDAIINKSQAVVVSSGLPVMDVRVVEDGRANFKSAKPREAVK